MVLLVGGIALLTIDVRLRNLGVATLVGLVAFGAGSWLAWSDVAGAIRISPWLIAGAVVASLLYYGFALTVAIQSRDRIVSTQKGLIGLIGEARGKLAPEGPVYVKGAMWRGRSAGEPILPARRSGSGASTVWCCGSKSNRARNPWARRRGRRSRLTRRDPRPRVWRSGGAPGDFDRCGNPARRESRTTR